MGKYDGLGRFLCASPTREIQLTFDQIQVLVAGGLPRSAFKYQAWWSNEPAAGHVQAQAWMDNGWRVSRVDLAGRAVTFSLSPQPGCTLPAPAHEQEDWDSCCGAAPALLSQEKRMQQGKLASPSPTTSGTEPTAPTGLRDSTTRRDDSVQLAITGRQPQSSKASIRTPSRDIGLAASTTAQGIRALAPPVQDRIRQVVAQTDPDLDEDLHQWLDPDTTRPRLHVLGPVRVDASGDLPASRPRLPWHTEVIAYLGTHPRGVSPSQLGTDLWPDEPDIQGKPKVRQAIFRVRRWLGTNPRTGQNYVPQLKTTSGSTVYRVEDLLSDADLFRRLRLRGVSRGHDGICDLETALTLVAGPAFDPAQRRDKGYAWLSDILVDIEYTAMVIDVAHLVATHHLSTGRPDLAARSARIALLAGTQDDIPLLDLVAASDAQGHRAEAARWIKQILSGHDADIEEDLPPRTAELLIRRRYHTD